MTERLFAAHARGELAVTVGRASDLFGPWMAVSALGERTFGPLVFGRAAEAPGDPDQPHSWTDVEDFGEALAVLGERDEAPGRASHVPNAPPTLAARAAA
jgi:nucleoside-diphosphate-sugar epimerase